MLMKHTNETRKHPTTQTEPMKRSLQIVSLITLIASGTAVHANEQAPAYGQPSKSVKQQQARKSSPFQKYWAAKSWDAGASDFWHSAKREVVSIDKASSTKAAVRVKEQQAFRRGE